MAAAAELRAAHRAGRAAMGREKREKKKTPRPPHRGERQPARRRRQKHHGRAAAAAPAVGSKSRVYPPNQTNAPPDNPLRLPPLLATPFYSPHAPPAPIQRQEHTAASTVTVDRDSGHFQRPLPCHSPRPSINVP